jgi:hypothetical protein
MREVGTFKFAETILSLCARREQVGGHVWVASEVFMKARKVECPTPEQNTKTVLRIGLITAANSRAFNRVKDAGRMIELWEEFSER